jgi:AbiV family abortive infection protein
MDLDLSGDVAAALAEALTRTIDGVCRSSPRTLMLDLLKKSSHRHSFPLNQEQIPALLHRYYCNGVELYEDAALLRANKRYARAVFLCLAAFEELAKIPLALNAIYLPHENTKAWKRFWKTLNSHSHKQRAAMVYGSSIMRQINLERWQNFYAKGLSENLPLNELKLASLYVDCYGGIPLQPERIFAADGPLISTIFEVVKNRLDAYGEIHSTIDKSIAFVREALHISLPPDMLQSIVDSFAS